MQTEGNTKNALQIDPEFRGLLPILTTEELAALEESIEREGCRDALIVWGNTLVDGHNRHEICTRRGFPFQVRQMAFGSREDVIIWICANQNARRNVAQEQEAYLQGRGLDMSVQFEYREINSRSIISDQDYQHQLNQVRVSNINKEFDPDLVNEPKISFRDGRYYVFDGQHTIALLKLRNGGRDLPILCKVYYGKTKTEEARLFEDQTSRWKRNPSASDKLRSRFNRGEKRAVDLVLIAEKHGFTIAFNSAKIRNRIVACAAADRVLLKYGAEAYSNVLSILRDVWDGAPESVSKQIMEAVAIFCDNYESQYDRGMLVRKLRRVNPLRSSGTVT